MFPKPKLFLIEWEDACFDDSTLVVDQISDEAQIHISVGWLVKETKARVWLAQSEIHDPRHPDLAYQDTLQIPKGVIRKRKRLT